MFISAKPRIPRDRQCAWSNVSVSCAFVPHLCVFEPIIFCSSVADVELFCRSTFGVQDSLNAVTPIPYCPVELPPKLRFGYYTSGASVLLSLLGRFTIK